MYNKMYSGSAGLCAIGWGVWVQLNWDVYITRHVEIPKRSPLQSENTNVIERKQSVIDLDMRKYPNVLPFYLAGKKTTIFLWMILRRRRKGLSRTQCAHLRRPFCIILGLWRISFGWGSPSQLLYRYTWRISESDPVADCIGMCHAGKQRPTPWHFITLAWNVPDQYDQLDLTYFGKDMKYTDLKVECNPHGRLALWRGWVVVKN